MQFNELKEALQPTIAVDMEQLYTEFVQERGSGDLVAFVTELYRKQHITQETLHRLVNEGALNAEWVGTLAGQNEENDTPSKDAGTDASGDTSESAAPSVEDNASESEGVKTRKGGASVRSSRRKTGSRPRPRNVRSSGARSGARQSTSPKDKLRKTMFGWRQTEKEDEVPSDTTDLLKREYSFHGLVGEGAMGRVLRAKDLDLMRVVAYKEMSEEIAATPSLASKFYGEAQITAQLDHPNIVPVYHLEQTNDGMLAYTMKLIQGQTLEQLIEEVQEQYKTKKQVQDDLELPERLDIFLRMCDAMYYAHSRGVVHRDLKPENIMIGAYGEVYVMDWGISIVAEMDGVDQETKITLLTEQEDEGEMVIGTPQYMSPEQAHGENNNLTHLSDQYSMGLILHELVCLKPAVTGKTAIKIVMRQQDGEKDPLTHIMGEKIPKELEAIIAKATAHDRDKRYSDVHELAEDIRRYQRGEEVLARPDSRWRKFERWIGKHKQLTAFVILSVFFVGSTLMIGSWLTIWYLNYLETQERQQLQNLESFARSHASDVDSSFQRYEGLLGVLVASSSDMLSRKSVPKGKSNADGANTNNDALSHVDAFDAGEVDTLVDAKRYGYPVSLEHASYMIAEDKQTKAMADYHLRRLPPIRRHFRNVVLRSYSEAAAGFSPSRIRDRIAKRGTPISWAYIGLNTGLYAVYPGHGDIPDSFDVRERPWFEKNSKRSKSDRGPAWGSPTIDVHGLGKVLTCVQPIYSHTDEFLGLAGIDVTYDYLMDELLPLDNVNGIDSIYILDGDGREVVNTSSRIDKSSYEKGQIRNRTIRMPEFDVPEVVEKIKSRRSGHLQTYKDGKEVLVLYLLMNNTNWYLVIVGDKDEMLSSYMLSE